MLPYRLELGPPTSRVFFPMDHRGYEIGGPLPRRCSFADPSGNILGSKLCTGATLSLLILLFLYLNLLVVLQTCILIFINTYILIPEKSLFEEKDFYF